MKKRLLSLLLTVAMVLSLLAFPASAETAASGTCGDNLTWVLDDNGTLTISGTGDMTNWSRDDYAPWYSNRTSIKSVVIKVGVTSIGDFAFYDCTSLTDFTIPAGVTSIGWNAFADCIGLTSVTIPADVTSIGSYAFRGCSSLTSITIPKGVTSIGFENFYDCTSLTSITIPDSVTSIDYHAFEGCSSLTSITIPDSVNTIEDFAFNNCTNLADVYYRGSEEDWSKITIEADNECLTNATIHFNSADPEPTITLFDDVQDSSAWYYTSVYWAVENHITSGTGNNQFSPTKECTRAQIVTFLWNAAGQPEPTTATSKFTDVDSSAWYYKAVLWAVENGVTSGTTETTFSPDMKCSRAQIVTFLWNCEGKYLATQNSAFTDVPASAWYYAAVQWAVENKVTSGTGNNQFSPNTICSRAQAVTFLYNDLAQK